MKKISIITCILTLGCFVSFTPGLMADESCYTLPENPDDWHPIHVYKNIVSAHLTDGEECDSSSWECDGCPPAAQHDINLGLSAVIAQQYALEHGYADGWRVWQCAINAEGFPEIYIEGEAKLPDKCIDDECQNIVGKEFGMAFRWGEPWGQVIVDGHMLRWKARVRDDLHLDPFMHQVRFLGWMHGSITGVFQTNSYSELVKCAKCAAQLISRITGQACNIEP